jgi:hypothetical protein
MLNGLKKRFAEFIEATFERTIVKFYDQRHYYHTNHSPEVRIPLKQLYLDYRNRVADNKSLPTYKEAGMSVYSQYDEDGITLYIFGIIGFNTFYLRNDLATPYLPEISVEEVLAHPRNIKQMQIFEEMKHLPFETIDK